MNPSTYNSVDTQSAANRSSSLTPPSGAIQSRAGLSSFPNRMAMELAQFNKVAASIRADLRPADEFEQRCQQAFDLANDLFANAPTWVCFYRELMGGSGLINDLFADLNDYGKFLRTEQYHQIQLMLTALRSRDLPENDPNDPQRMITVRLPKSLHEAMCEEAGRLNISVNRLCISRMLQLLDPKMIPETQSKPRGRKPRTRSRQVESTAAVDSAQGCAVAGDASCPPREISTSTQVAQGVNSAPRELSATMPQSSWAAQSGLPTQLSSSTQPSSTQHRYS